MKIGKAQYESKKRKNYFSIKDGDHLFRILPPLGNLADKNKWAVYYPVHYGYLNSEKKMKPFVSPEWRNPKTKVIEVRDAAKDRLKEMEKALDDAKKSGQTAVAKAIEEMLEKYNLDNHWYMNAINANGEIGLLKIRHKAKLALDAEIKKLTAKGIDPTSVDQGRYFEFSRSGTGRDTVYSVKLAKKSENIPGHGLMEKDYIHVLDESIIARLETEAFELDSIFAEPSEEEVEAIVEGDKAKNYEAIDAILGVRPVSDEESLEEPVVEEEEEEGSADRLHRAKIIEEQAQSLGAAFNAATLERQAKTQKAETSKVTKTVKIEDTQSPDEILASLGL